MMRSLYQIAPSNIDSEGIAESKGCPCRGFCTGSLHIWAKDHGQSNHRQGAELGGLDLQTDGSFARAGRCDAGAWAIGKKIDLLMILESCCRGFGEN